MPFRIRQDIRQDSDDANRQKAEAAYRRHLDRFPKAPGSDLWTYFYWDFFHDGFIESLEVSPEARTVVLRLNCPNIKRYLSEDDYEYVDMDFECTFTEVMEFHIAEDLPSGRDEIEISDWEFYAAEINTSALLEDRVAAERGVFSSLIVELLAGDTCSYMEIVFDEVHVRAEDPAALARMAASPDYDVPIWSPE